MLYLRKIHALKSHILFFVFFFVSFFYQFISSSTNLCFINSYKTQKSFPRENKSTLKFLKQVIYRNLSKGELLRPMVEKSNPCDIYPQKVSL